MPRVSPLHLPPKGAATVRDDSAGDLHQAGDPVPRCG